MKNNSGFLPVILPEKSKFLVYIGLLGEQKTKGGIIISDRDVEDDAYASTSGSVVEVIMETTMNNHHKLDLKLGDTITFKPYAGIHIVGDDGHAYRLLDGREIHAKKLIKNEEK